MILEQLKGRLVVSCQALEGEPLHGAQIMAKMALAVSRGGAAGIRANTVQDIKAVRSAVALPVIGIVKRNYGDNPVFITPTCREVDELMQTGCDMIAMDATIRARPSESLDTLLSRARMVNDNVLLMGDVASLEDIDAARDLGFDCVSTALYGYTEQTAGKKLYDDDFAFLKQVVQRSRIPVVAEGNVLTPDMCRRCMDLGVHFCVVGSAITRPQLITECFAAACAGEVGPSVITAVSDQP